MTGEISGSNDDFWEFCEDQTTHLEHPVPSEHTGLVDPRSALSGMSQDEIDARVENLREIVAAQEADRSLPATQTPPNAIDKDQLSTDWPDTATEITELRHFLEGLGPDNLDSGNN